MRQFKTGDVIYSEAQTHVGEMTIVDREMVELLDDLLGLGEEVLEGLLGDAAAATGHGSIDPEVLAHVRQEILGTWMATGGQNADLGANPRLRPALERINRYGPNLYLLRGSQTTSTWLCPAICARRCQALSCSSITGVRLANS